MGGRAIEKGRPRSSEVQTTLVTCARSRDNKLEGRYHVYYSTVRGRSLESYGGQTEIHYTFTKRYRLLRVEVHRGPFETRSGGWSE